MHSLTAFDIVVLLMIAFAAFGGLVRGFVGEVVSLAAWVVAVLAVRFFYTPVKPFAVKVTGTESGGAILAFVALFIGAFLLVRLIGGSISTGTRNSVVGPIDRILGLGFGAAKGVLGASLLLVLVNMTFDTIGPGEPRPEWLAKARTAPLLKTISTAAIDFVEERRRVPGDAADAGAATGSPKSPEAGGYEKSTRDKLDELLKQEQQKQPPTPI